MSGQSVGGFYSRTDEKIRLEDQAVANIAADDKGAGAVALTAKSMVMLPAQHAIHLEQNARIGTENQTLIGDNAVIVFTDDEQAMKFLELRGQASVTPTEARQGSPTDMKGDNITLAFHPDGSAVQHATLTGQAPARAGRRGRPAFGRRLVDRPLHRARRQDADAPRRPRSGRGRSAGDEGRAGADDSQHDAGGDAARRRPGCSPRSSTAASPSKSAIPADAARRPSRARASRSRSS